jgi:hypothetical protein
MVVNLKSSVQRYPGMVIMHRNTIPAARQSLSNTPIIFLAAGAMSVIKELSTPWMPPPAWWKKYKERGMIALRVQDPAARHEKAIGSRGSLDPILSSGQAVFALFVGAD